MATAQIKAVITADDKASAVVKGFGDNVDKSSSKLQNFSQRAQGALAGITAIGVGAGLALGRLVDVLGDSVDAANKNQAALIGLSSVARAFGQSQDAANKAARDLAKDGLLSVTDAAKGLKNLLASGFSLDQAVTLMTRFKDSAAFGRQSALSFGDAVASATEGIKNGNSILVDNAGVTKNLSQILVEAGYSQQDLMKATTDSNVRMALFNGILKETNPQLGDAAKLTESFAGKQAMLTAQTTILQQQLGTALQPVLLNILQAIMPIVQSISEWIQKHPTLTSIIIVSTVALLAMSAIISTLVVSVGGLLLVFGPLGAAIAGAVAVGSAAIIGLAVAMAINFDKIKAKFNEIVNFSRDAMRMVALNIEKLIPGSLGALQQSLERIIWLFDRIKQVSQFSANIGLNALKGKIPGFAAGTNYAPGGLALVGESGPELVNLPRGSQVIPNNQISTSNNQSVNITIQAGAFIGNQADARRYAEMITNAMKDIAGSKNMTVAEMLG